MSGFWKQARSQIHFFVPPGKGRSHSEAHDTSVEISGRSYVGLAYPGSAMRVGTGLWFSANLGPLGVLSSCCTTITDRIPVSAG